MPGDLLFYGTDADVHHVSIYLGAGKMLHARTAAPLLIVIDIPPIKPADVSVVGGGPAGGAAGGAPPRLNSRIPNIRRPPPPPAPPRPPASVSARSRTSTRLGRSPLSSVLGTSQNRRPTGRRAR
ncbi:NlpC/P60 family protein [Nocardia cyriacigeorgica]|uniref:NlpC/P60 family protein n=1 Tax=Nocardia cyriacigeorgica TaxID=135487 RepID=UPI002456A19A|nr:NlpC/P60 family protein [Nocardia cyriacigeorgica]